MKIQIKRSGGVAGLLLPPLTMESDALSSEDSRNLRQRSICGTFASPRRKGHLNPRSRAATEGRSRRRCALFGFSWHPQDLGLSGFMGTTLGPDRVYNQGPN